MSLEDRHRHGPRTASCRDSRRVAAALLLGCLAGCRLGPSGSPPAGQYHRITEAPALELRFQAGLARLVPPDAAALEAVGRRLGGETLTLAAAGPLAPARTQAVADAVRRPVALVPGAPGEPDRGLLLLPVRTAISADACRGRGEPIGMDIWPGDDAGRQRLLPPGCATAAMIQAQVVDERDLLRGRDLPPTAALPFARAIENYGRRNDEPQGGGVSRSGAPRSPGSQDQGLQDPGGQGSGLQNLGLQGSGLSPVSPTTPALPATRDAAPSEPAAAGNPLLGSLGTSAAERRSLALQ